MKCSLQTYFIVIVIVMYLSSKVMMLIIYKPFRDSANVIFVPLVGISNTNIEPSCTPKNMQYQ